MSHHVPDDLPFDLVLDFLLRPGSVEQRQIDALTPQTWDAITRRLREQRALPFLLNTIQNSSALQLPKDVTQDLIVSARQWGTRQLLMGGECQIIHRGFAERNIPHLFLKGVPLAFGFYEGPSQRPVRDIDILVPRDNLFEARDCIMALGGGKIPEFAGTEVDVDADTFKHLSPIWSPNRIIAVELHSRLFPQAADHASPELENFAAGLWAGRATFSISGSALPCPTPMAMALHLLSHAIYEDCFQNGPLFLVDIQRLIESGMVDPQAFHEQACRFGMARGSALTFHMLGIEIPSEQVSPSLEKAATRLVLQRRTKSGWEENVIDLGKVMQRKGMQSFWPLLKRLFPKREELLSRRRKFDLEGGEEWSFLRLWISFLGDRIKFAKVFLASREGRSNVRDTMTIREWLTND
ncbi:nucleotidyltransferase family protein [Roseobacter sp. GAI101]|uniref:nucleotidyltransferase family protein n=1 Tax=Roseobacter sp. (strain GAI101) TaxID=391589 RepID=UPI0001871B64|nr:nucleotidyltransferase family protein [Roseobacter sp. GAI101]EEB82648.1 conserved hypothetical protein [Roseobacter sp. GAI101]